MSIDPWSALLDVGKSALERLWPDPIRRAEEFRKLEELYQAGQIERLKLEVQLLVGQMDVNKAEAQHPNIFIAGWRPFVGWVCGIALLYAGILEPLMRFTATMAGYTGPFPIIDTDLTLQILLGMLGLGAMRSHDKLRKVDTKKTG